MPIDFPEMFVLLGWEAIEDHYQASQRAVRRWMRQVGELDLIARRRGYLRKVYAARGCATAGGRKPGSKAGGLSEAPASDPALAFMPVRRLRRRYEGAI